ncbi:unnamed protein product [Closterium sp. NIES-53]
MYLMTCTRPDLAYPLSLLACYVAPGRHRKVHWDAAKRVLRYLCSTSAMGLVLEGRGPVVLTGHADASWVDDSATQRSFSCEAEIYAGAMAAQELRWLTYLLTDLGEQPRLPPQHGQLRLAYVATRANTTDVFTKALPPGDHQRFATVLGLLTLLFLTGRVTTCLTTPTSPTLNQPLTELLGRLGLAPTLLLLSLTTTRASTPRSRPATTSPTASTAATPSAASTAATRAPTAATSPTAATTSTASITSTAVPTTAPTATSATPAATSTTLTTLALAVAGLRTSRSSIDVLSNRDVCSSSRGEGGGKGGGGAPLKEGRGRSATSSTYSNCTSLSCEEMLLEEVNSEGGGVKGEKMIPDRAKRVREAKDYEVEGDEHGGLVRSKELSRDGSAVASVASARVGNQVRYCGKRGQLREQVGQ